jgi:hypothetical protein
MNLFIKSELTIICFALFSCNSGNEPKNGHQKMGEIDSDTIIVLTAFNSKHEQNVQTFEINLNKKQTINGNQGTIVTFPAQCFGKVQGLVKIELIECYSIQEMILNGLSTQTTDGKLLESDGMIYLNALNEKGDTLEIMQGKVKVQMPTKQRKENIQIFEGINTSSGITWDLTNEKLKIGEISNIIKQNQNNGPQIEVEDPEHNFTIQPKTGQSQIVIDKQIKNEFLVNYVFNITEMGWINCDRYIEGETQDLFVSVGKEQENVSIYLVLDKRNSNVMPRNPKAVNGKFELL